MKNGNKSLQKYKNFFHRQFFVMAFLDVGQGCQCVQLKRHERRYRYGSDMFKIWVRDNFDIIWCIWFFPLFHFFIVSTFWRQWWCTICYLGKGPQSVKENPCNKRSVQRGISHVGFQTLSILSQIFKTAISSEWVLTARWPKSTKTFQVPTLPVLSS